MKVQILLVLVMLAALAGMLLSRWSVLLLAVALAAFLISAAPFLRKAWKKDREVALAAPILLIARAAALGAGYSWGLLRPQNKPGNEYTIGSASYLAKRTMDITGGAVGLLGTLVVGLIIAPAIKLDSPGSVIFRQERVGQEGRAFTLYKFRSMVEEAERSPDVSPTRDGADRSRSDPVGRVPPVKLKDDPRLTRVGRFLRRWSLDELPQFWNVLKGDMSLVGPRPEETRYVALYDDWQRRRLAVKPGITGPMQVSGRADLPLDARVDLELEYIKNYSVGRDLSLLLQTIPAVLRGEGAR
jgi:lipopolysaccharide/colanic/teichoic acid biosynthesis glycosyltransferase